MSDRTNAISEFLSRLEQAESRLLSWGMVDGSFSDADVLDLADGFLTSRGLWDEFGSAEELLEALSDRRLLFSFLEGIDIRYRTRMGEAVRLDKCSERICVSVFALSNQRLQRRTRLVRQRSSRQSRAFALSLVRPHD